MRLFSLTFAVLLSLVSACQLQAGVVSNGSFDNGDFSGADSNNAKTLGVGSTLITDWTVITNPIV